MIDKKRSVTIVTYHYVRDTHKTRFPNIKALPINAFGKQLDYFQRTYSIIGLDECAKALQTNADLPPNALALTFDDGLTDHFTTVFPILKKKRLKAAFFPNTLPLVEQVVLDVHKIHFILASVADIDALLEELFSALDEHRSRYPLLTREEYRAHYALPGIFDNSEVMLLKRLLQRVLPEAVRHEIVQDLFTKYVTKDEKSFARQLYLTKEQLKTLATEGMHIGVHGHTHEWMSEFTPHQQRAEIQRCLATLKAVVPVNNWSISYPYGAYNDSLLTILKEADCVLGLTTKKGVAHLSQETALTLPRFDTNHFPQS